MHSLRHPVMRLAVVVIATALATACASRVQAPPPPASAPGFSEELVVAGPPVTVAAKAARTLGMFSYNTRRFGADSTWGYRATDRVNIRLRYVRPSRDSTRILAELWGTCERGGQACLRGEFAALAAGIRAEEGPPP